MYIDGEWVAAGDGKSLVIIDPATEDQVDTTPWATAADLDRALAAAERAWPVWREVDVWTRSATLRRTAGLLRERADGIASVLTEEQGKPLQEARAEVMATADQFDWYGDEARRIYGRSFDGHSRGERLMVIRQPIGPVAAFTPWNFPALLPARKMAPALAAGCSIIVKPAEEAPRTCLCLAQACHDAGVPPGVVNVVTGDPAQISTHLIRSPIIRKVSLTGSLAVGRELMRLCADEIKPVTMELGGHAPVLVFEDAAIDFAAETAARAKFRNGGQVCIAASRFFVQESVVEPFLKRFVEVTRSLRVGDGREPSTDVGPLSNLRRLEATDALVKDALEKGARLECGGQRPTEFRRGFYYLPTVLSNASNEMRVFREEPFCPVAPVASFTDLEDAAAKANASSYGLAGYVFTRNITTMFRASESLEVGMVGVNNMMIAAAEMPFGGVKQSGFGREGGTEGIEAYTVTKYINVRL
jgi:succinate-semialdehyde dehydrogenase/glutarate-semialdehyde dehydrogenase